MEENKKRTKLQEVWSRLKRNRPAMVSLFIILALVLLALTVDLIFDYKEQVIKVVPMDRLLPPSPEHWFGTDESGRDIFARVLYGTRVSMSIGFLSTALSMSLAVILGSLAGFYGGWIDNLIMRITDIFLAIPSILLIVALVAALGTSMVNLILAMAISHVPGFVRVVRASVLTIKGMDYIEAAQALGARPGQTIRKHIIANSLAPIIVQATLGISSIIISASALSYIGLGVQAPMPEWGNMLSQGKEVIRSSPHVMLFPGLFIFITSLSFNLLGDGLRDALDPKLKN